MTPSDVVRIQSRMVEFVAALLREGPDAAALDDLIRRYADDAEFVRLALLARELKRSARTEIAPGSFDNAPA